MIEHVCRLEGELSAVLLGGGNDRFDGFLAEFLGDAADAAVEQRLGIGLVRSRSGAICHDGGEISQGEACHFDRPPRNSAAPISPSASAGRNEPCNPSPAEW